jgi:hypothetical protein
MNYPIVDLQTLANLGLESKFANPVDADFFEAEFLLKLEDNAFVIDYEFIPGGYRILLEDKSNKPFYVSYYPLADKLLVHFDNRYYVDGLEWLVENIDF